MLNYYYYNEGLFNSPNKILNRLFYVFHDEHMVPVKMILDELQTLDIPNYDNVKKY